MFDVGGGELLLIVMAILLLFGPEKLPELARSFGKGMSYLRQAQTDFQRNLNAMTDEVEELVQKQPITTVSADSPPDLPAFERSLSLKPSATETPFDEHTEAAAIQESMQAPTPTIRPAENTIAVEPKAIMPKSIEPEHP